MQVLGSINTQRRNLSLLAGKQYGYFTAGQAIAIGYADPHHRYHINKGHWLKIATGLFRLPDYPDSMESDLTKWSLWSRNQSDQPQGIISHRTALAYYGLAEYDPENIHMTVPLRFQKKVPHSIILHKEQLSLSVIECKDCFMVTRLGRTLSDVREELKIDMVFIPATRFGAGVKNLY